MDQGQTSSLEIVIIAIAAQLMQAPLSALQVSFGERLWHVTQL